MAIVSNVGLHALDAVAPGRLTTADARQPITTNGHAKVLVITTRRDRSAAQSRSFTQTQTSFDGGGTAQRP
jgi:hypothetical protein